MDFAKSTLSPLRGLLSSRQAASDAMLHEVMGLVCYENPMVSCRRVLPHYIAMCGYLSGTPYQG